MAELRQIIIYLSARPDDSADISRAVVILRDSAGEITRTIQPEEKAMVARALVDFLRVLID